MRWKSGIHSVYGITNGAGQIIYVGSTGRGVLRRVAEHRRNQLWRDEIAGMVTFAKDLTAAAAAEREVAEIRKRRPRYNVRDNPRPVRDPRQLRAFEQTWGFPPGSTYFTAAGRVEVPPDLVAAKAANGARSRLGRVTPPARPR